MINETHFRPENSVKITMKCGGATFYTFKDSHGRPCAYAYIGKSQKPNGYWFRSEARRDAWMKKIADSVTERKKATEARRKARNMAHNLEVGHVLYTSWGYDQTNVEFYKVVEVPSKCFVVLVEVSAPLMNGEEGYMTGQRFPDLDATKGEPFRRKVDMSGGTPSVQISSCQTAWIWDGKPKRVSWYA